MTAGRFRVHGTDGLWEVTLKGREEWALSHLIASGDRGCTPITTPGPRWSDYVFKLRRRGIDVATIIEAHGGPYSGHHARYRLISKIERMPDPTTQARLSPKGESAHA